MVEVKPYLYINFVFLLMIFLNIQIQHVNPDYINSDALFLDVRVATGQVVEYVVNEIHNEYYYGKDLKNY